MRKQVLISVQTDVISGVSCFTGTRVPVAILFDYIIAGEALESFLESYPGVTREHAQAVLALALERLLQFPPAHPRAGWSERLRQAIAAGQAPEGDLFAEPDLLLDNKE